MLKRLAKNIYVISMGNKVIAAILAMVTSVIINRFLGVSVKGEYVSILAYTSVAGTVLDFGIYQSYPYFKKKYGGQMLNTFGDLVSVQFLVYLASAIIASCFAGSLAVRLAIVLVPTIVLSVQLYNMVLAEDIKYRTKVNIATSVVYLINMSVLFAVFKKCGNVAVPISVMIVNQLLYIVLLTRKVKPGFRIKKEDWAVSGKIIRFGLYPMLTVLLLTLNYKLGIMTLRFLGIPSAGIGIFSTGVALSEYMWIVPNSFSDVMFNKTSKGNPVEEILVVLKATFLFGIACVAGISLLGRQVITLLYGAEFAPAYRVTIVLFVGVISMMYFKIIGMLYLSNGKRQIYFYTLLCSAVLNEVLNFILIPRFQIMGAAFATAVSYTAMGLVFAVSFAKLYKIRFFGMLILNKKDIRLISGRFRYLLGKPGSTGVQDEGGFNFQGVE